MTSTTLTNITQRTLCRCSQCGEICLSGEGKNTAVDGWVCKRCLNNYHRCGCCDEIYLTDELRQLDEDESVYACPTCYKAEMARA